MKNVREPEYWLDVPGSKKYQVSNYGNFRRRLKKGGFRILTPYVRKDRWFFVKVDFNGMYRDYLVHHIVAAVFLSKAPEEGMVLYHKNMMKRDNYAGNIGWIRKSDLGKKSGKLANKSIAIVKYDKDTGEMIDFYRSISQAARENFIHKETIRLALIGRLKTAAGFVWKKEPADFLGEEGG